MFSKKEKNISSILWLHSDPEVIWEGRGPNPEVDFLAGNFWRKNFFRGFFGREIFFTEIFFLRFLGSKSMILKFFEKFRPKHLFKNFFSIFRPNLTPDDFMTSQFLAGTCSRYINLPRVDLLSIITPII